MLRPVFLLSGTEVWNFAIIIRLIKLMKNAVRLLDPESKGLRTTSA